MVPTARFVSAAGCTHHALHWIPCGRAWPESRMFLHYARSTVYTQQGVTWLAALLLLLCIHHYHQSPFSQEQWNRFVPMFLSWTWCLSLKGESTAARRLWEMPLFSEERGFTCHRVHHAGLVLLITRIVTLVLNMNRQQIFYLHF